MTVTRSKLAQCLGQSLTYRSQTRTPVMSRTTITGSLAGIALSILASACAAETAQPGSSTQELETRARPDHPVTSAGSHSESGGTGGGSDRPDWPDWPDRPCHPRPGKPCKPACGDGVVHGDEECDDGNTIGGDGCSASCTFDNNPKTPGDDRPGVMVCGVGQPPCRTDGQCCESQGKQQCVRVPTACRGRANYCDGPEDCATGEVCWQARSATCIAEDSTPQYGDRRCHTDADCDKYETCSTKGTCGW